MIFSEESGLLAALSLATFLSYHGYLAAAVVVCTAIIIHRRAARLRRAAADKNLLQRVVEETMQKKRLPVGFDLPRWVTYPDTHKVPWLNDAISVLWPYAKLYLRGYLHDNLEPILEASRPPIVTKLGFRDFDLGRAPLIINGVKTFAQTKDEIIFDIDMKLHTIDSAVIFDVGLAGLIVAVELENFEFQGTLRLSLTNLLAESPVIGAVAYTFVKKPTIDFDLRIPGSLNVMALPLISQWLTDTIKDSVFDGLVLPSVAVVPLADLSVLEMQKVRSRHHPSGVLEVRLVGARGIHRRWAIDQLFSRFSVELSLGSQTHRSCPLFGAFPVFDENFNFVVHSKDAHLLRIDIIAERPWSRLFSGAEVSDTKNHIVFGSGSKPLSRLEPRRRKACKLPLVSEASGNEAHCDLVLTWRPIRLVQTGEVHADLSSGGVLVITLIECHDLRSMDLLSGTANPFVQVRCGNVRKQSTPRMRTLNPQWMPPESFEFVIDDHASLEIEVFDNANLLVEGARNAVSLLLLQGSKGADSMGKAVVDLSDIARTAGAGIVDRQVELNHGTGCVVITMQFFTYG